MKPYTFGNFFARGEKYFYEKYISKCPWECKPLLFDFIQLN